MGTMKPTSHVFVAMSGGVDSAVCAAKLLDDGYRVTGIHMETWQDPKWNPLIAPTLSTAAIRAAYD